MISFFKSCICLFLILFKFPFFLPASDSDLKHGKDTSEEAFDVFELISPPMTFSKELPVAISLKNQRQFQENVCLNFRERKELEASLAAKKPPWVMLISAAVVLIAIAIILA